MPNPSVREAYRAYIRETLSTQDKITQTVQLGQTLSPLLYGAVPDCVGGGDGVTNGNTFSAASFRFTSYYKGKDLYIGAWKCRVLSVNEDGSCVFEKLSAPSNATGVEWSLGGTDKTAESVIGGTDGVIVNSVLTSPSYNFTTAGVPLYINGIKVWADYASGTAMSFSQVNLYNANNLTWYCGTDSTVALYDWLQACKRLSIIPGGDGGSADTTGWGFFSPMYHGVLPPGACFMVRNTQTRYSAGIHGAVVIPKRVALSGHGVAQSHIQIMPGNVGYGILNENGNRATAPWTDFVFMKDFSVFGNGYLQGVGVCLALFKLRANFDGYSKTDPQWKISGISLWEPPADGFAFTGRGQSIFERLMVGSAGGRSYFCSGLVDSSFITCDGGGAQHAGMYINSCAPFRATNCKLFYSGSGGGTDVRKSANWVLTGDIWPNGGVTLIGCEGQEAHGSNFLIETGGNQLIGCIAGAAGRRTMQSGGQTTVRAGVHLRQVNADLLPNETVIADMKIGRDLEVDYASYDQPGYAGTHALYIEGTSIREVCGNIWSGKGNAFEGGVVAGSGVATGLNPNLKVNGTAVTGAVASVPTNVSNVIATPGSGQMGLAWTAPAGNGGASITDYKIEYRAGDTGTWLEFAHTAGTALSRTVTGLSAGLYGFRVSAVNSVGSGPTKNSKITATVL